MKNWICLLLFLLLFSYCKPVHEYHEIKFSPSTKVVNLTSEEQDIYIDYEIQSYRETKTTLLEHFRQFQFRLNIGTEIGEAITGSEYENWYEINPNNNHISLMIHIPENTTDKQRSLSIEIRLSTNWTKYWEITDSKESIEWGEWKEVFYGIQSGRTAD